MRDTNYLKDTNMKTSNARKAIETEVARLEKAADTVAKEAEIRGERFQEQIDRLYDRLEKLDDADDIVKARARDKALRMAIKVLRDNAPNKSWTALADTLETIVVE